MADIAIFLTNGFEEIEALTVVDLLRRAEMDVLTVSVTGGEWVTGSHQITVKADVLFEKLDWDHIQMLVLPGGPGVNNLMEHEGLVHKVIEFHKEGKMLAAICGAPRILGKYGILKEKPATCYPGLEDQLLEAEFREDSVVCADNVITSRGLGTAIDFALAIIAHYKGEELAGQIGQSIVYLDR